MSPPGGPSGYQVWGLDNFVHGPVELPLLIEWANAGRLRPDTWVYNRYTATWLPAGQMPQLRAVFSMLERATRDDSDTVTIFNPLIPALRPTNLRRVKVLTDLTDAQLVRFAQMMEFQVARPREVVVREGAPADSLFLILEGEVRVRLMVGDRETTLATLEPGDLFGETCLFDQGPRSADVVANGESSLLRITTERLRRLATEYPDLAAPFLMGIGRTMSARIRADNKRFHDFLAIRQASGG